MLDVGQNFNHYRFMLEILYASIILVLFLVSYLKLDNLQRLTNYEGIKILKASMLFFALAFFSRLIQYVVRFLMMLTELEIKGRFIAQSSLIVMMYLTSMAVVYLIYSNYWKKISLKYVLIYAHIGLLLFYYLFSAVTSIWVILAFQLLVSTILILATKKNIRFIYVLMSLFWIINMFLIYGGRGVHLEIKIILQLTSVIFLIYFTKKLFSKIK